MSNLAKRRAALYSYIYKYEQRKKLTKKEGTRLNIENKIKEWQQEMYQIDILTNKMVAIANAINLFIGKSVRSIGRSNRKDPENRTIRAAKGIFYKYGMEAGILGIDLAQFVGASRKDEASLYRKWFNDERRKDAELDAKWHRFKEHMIKLSAPTNDFIDNRKATG